MSRITDLFRAVVRPGPLAVGVALGMIVAAGVAARSWLGAREDRMRLEATLAAQQQVIAAAESRERQRAEELRGALAQIADLKRSVNTPQQIIRELPQYLPLPQPIQITSGQEPGRGERSESTRAPAASGGPSPDKAVAQMPVEDLKPLFDFVQDCRACKVQLTSAQADLQDERAKGAALIQQRDSAVRAAKGGGFWTRMRRGAKWFVIGGAVGAAAAAAAR